MMFLVFSHLESVNKLYMDDFSKGLERPVIFL